MVVTTGSFLGFTPLGAVISAAAGRRRRAYPSATVAVVWATPFLCFNNLLSQVRIETIQQHGGNSK